MERRSLTPSGRAVSELLTPAIANLRATYVALGLAVPGAYRLEGNGYEGVLGPEAHGVCNFAVVETISPATASELANVARESPAFCIYFLAPEGSENRSGAETLRRAGFGNPSIQKVLIREYCPTAPEAALDRIERAEERRELSDLLTHIFFEFAPLQFRRVMAQATADAAGTQLFAWREGGEVLGGAMACATSETWGLYDVGVKEPFRGRGIGRRIVEGVANLAPYGSRFVTLQCHRPLAPWYKAMGFEEVAEMTTLTQIGT